MPACLGITAIGLCPHSTRSAAASGRTRITLRAHNEVYAHMPPNAMVHNIVIGRTWVDAFGPFTVLCPATGSKCVLTFSPCGWFGYGRYEFSGFIVDKGETSFGDAPVIPS